MDSVAEVPANPTAPEAEADTPEAVVDGMEPVVVVRLTFLKLSKTSSWLLLVVVDKRRKQLVVMALTPKLPQTQLVLKEMVVEERVEMVATVRTAIVCQETLVLDSSMVDKAVAVEPVEPLTFVPTALQI